MTTTTPQDATMWAVRFHSYGEPADVLVEDQVAIPEPPKDRIRVRVLTVDVNPADWELCRGFMPGDLPRGIGLDVAGVVDAVGEDVHDVEVGDLVFGTADFFTQPSAGIADQAILDMWFPLPAGVSLVDAAALIMPLRTAAGTLDNMGVDENTTLLVHGAGSTIGHAATQVALQRGATVLATAGSTHAEELKGFGAKVTDRGEGMAERLKALHDGPIDLVLDASPTNAATLAQLTQVVDDPAIITTVSNHGQAQEFGVQSNLVPTGRPITPIDQLVPQYTALLAEGRFSLPVSATRPLAQWRELMELSTSGRAGGKLVLVAPDADAVQSQR